MPKANSKSRRPLTRSRTRRRAQLARPVQHRGLERLRQRFGAFREANAPTARIPVPLREAVVALLRTGVSRSAVQKSCGVSWSQMSQWFELYGSQPSSVDASQSASARVLSVVDDGPVGSQSSKPMVESPSEPVGSSEPTVGSLELRLGGWSITVRAVERIAKHDE
jgi:hypothetical protein